MLVFVRQMETWNSPHYLNVSYIFLVEDVHPLLTAAASKPSSSLLSAAEPHCTLTNISKYHFNFCCQHQITYFISCPVKHRKATRRISFASVVRPCLSQRQARLPTDSFNYGQISDRFSSQIKEQGWVSHSAVPPARCLYIPEYVTAFRDT